MKKTITGFITYQAAPRWMGGSSGSPSIDFFTFDPRKSDSFKDHVVVKQHSFEVEVPDDFDPRPELVKNLEAELTKARADFEMTVTRIKREISQHQALEHAA